MSGSFNWSHKAVTTLETATGGENWSVVASHDGYRKRFGAEHRRTLSSTPEGFAIRDKLTGTVGLEAEIVLQLAPEWHAQMKDGTVPDFARPGNDCDPVLQGAGGHHHQGGWRHW